MSCLLAFSPSIKRANFTENEVDMTNTMTIVTLAFMGNHALALQASPQG